MKLTRGGNLSVALLIPIALMLVSSTHVAASPVIWTDKPDYSPEQIVKIGGSGFAAGAIVTVSVTRPNRVTDSWSVTADSSGAFTTTYQLDGITGTYYVKATDGTNTATTTFTDANTQTSLDPISTPLTAGQIYPWSGSVHDSNPGAGLNDVELRYTSGPPGPCPVGASGTLVALDNTDSAGSFSGTFTAPAAGTYQFYARFNGLPGFGASESACQTITVNAVTTTTVSSYVTSTTTSTTESSTSSSDTTRTTETSTTTNTNPTSTTVLTTVTLTSGPISTEYTLATTYTTSYTRSTFTNPVTTSQIVTGTTSTASSELVGRSTTATSRSTTSSTSGSTVYAREDVTFNVLETWLEHISSALRILQTEIYQLLFELKVDPIVQQTVVIVVPTTATATTTPQTVTQTVTATQTNPAQTVTVTQVNPPQTITVTQTSAVQTVTVTQTSTSTSGTSTKTLTSTSTTTHSTTMTTVVTTTTSGTSTATQTTTSTQQPGSPGLNLPLAVLGLGVGLAALVAVAAPRPVEGSYYCRRHRSPVWSFSGHFYCPVESRYLNRREVAFYPLRHSWGPRRWLQRLLW